MIISKEHIGLLSVGLTLIAYIPYFRSLVAGETRPHLFSWIIWTVMNGMAFAAQYMQGAGAGSWMTGFTALISLAVIGFAFRSGEKNITRSDWLAFGGALLAIALWLITKDPLASVIIVSLIDLLACYPTLRKSYNKPWEENVFLYTMCGVRSLLGLFALEAVSLVTALYPIAMTTSNGLITFMLLWRRSKVERI